MIATLWTLSGLAAELELDRRTLAKQLTGLAPDEIEQRGNRTERRWRLARVVAHLANPNDEDLDLNAERAALARVQRMKAEIELAELRGTVVRVEMAAALWMAMVASARAKFLALPSRLAVAIGPPDRLYQIQEAARELVYEALNEFADHDCAPEETLGRWVRHVESIRATSPAEFRKQAYDLAVALGADEAEAATQ